MSRDARSGPIVMTALIALSCAGCARPPSVAIPIAVDASLDRRERAAVDAIANEANRRGITGVRRLTIRALAFHDPQTGPLGIAVGEPLHDGYAFALTRRRERMEVCVCAPGAEHDARTAARIAVHAAAAASERGSLAPRELRAALRGTVIRERFHTRR